LTRRTIYAKTKAASNSLFVAFRTEEELSQHNFMLHQRGGVDKKKHEEANLLGFKTGGKADSKAEEIKFKDDEAMDFEWYFSANYKVKDPRQEKRREQQEAKENRESRDRNRRNNKKHENRKEEETPGKPSQKAIGNLPSDEDKVDKVLKALRKFVSTIASQNEDSIPDSIRLETKTKMKHLYKVIGRMTPAKIMNYEFLTNFGVSIKSKTNLKKAVDYALNYAEFKKYLDNIPFREVLMIHKYFTFADKKIKVIMYKEQIDKVSDDLLNEVNEKPEKVSKTEVQAKKKRDGNKVVRANKKVDKLKDEFKDNLKNGITEEEFPALGGPPAPKQKSPPKKSPGKAPTEEVKTAPSEPTIGELEQEMKQNNELIKRHKLNPNKPNNKKKKSKKPTKMKMAKEEFPGLPGS